MVETYHVLQSASHIFILFFYVTQWKLETLNGPYTEQKLLVACGPASV